MLQRFTVVFGLMASVLIAQPTQTLKDETLTEHGYRLRVKKPRGWTLLPEKSAKSLSGDAFAAARGSYGKYCIFIAEPISSGTAASWTQKIIDSIELEERQIELRDMIEIQGVPAVRNIMSGKIKNLHLRWQHTIFVRKGYLFQIVCWNHKGRVKVDGSTFQTILDSVSFLEGRIRPRRAKGTTSDTRGIWWRIKDNVFESVPYSLRVKPIGRWTFQTGSDLRTMNADAEIGLAHDRSFIVLICEQARGVDQKALIEGKKKDIAESNKILPGTVKAKLLGKDIEFIKMALNPGATIHLLYAGLFVGDTFIQVQAWHEASYEKDGEKYLKKALPGITSLSEDRRSSLRKELEASPIQREAEGPGFRFHAGTYRNYKLGLVWTQPKGTWRVSVGDDARAVNSDSCLFIENPEAGLMAQVVVETVDPPMTPNAYHRASVDLTGAPATDASMTRIDGRPALLSKLTLKNSAEVVYHLHTVVFEKRHIQIVIWGMPGNVVSGKAAMADIIKGFKIL